MRAMRKRRRNLAAMAAAIALLGGPAAQAQSISPAAPRLPSTGTECAPGTEGKPDASSETTGSTSLSDQLSASKGVICPPAGVDPGMAAPPPPSGARMPVVPPPGTPGGDPGIQPK